MEIKDTPVKKCIRSDSLTSEFHQTFKEGSVPVTQKLFSKKDGEHIPKYFRGPELLDAKAGEK